MLFVDFIVFVVFVVFCCIVRLGGYPTKRCDCPNLTLSTSQPRFTTDTFSGYISQENHCAQSLFFLPRS